MGLYEEIKHFGEYFSSLRLHENLIIIDLLLPIKWEDEKILRQTTIDKGENTIEKRIILNPYLSIVYLTKMEHKN